MQLEQFVYSAGPAKRAAEGPLERAAVRPKPAEPALTTDQKEAFNAVLAGGNVCILGRGGTGKSFLLKKIRAALEQKRRRVAVVAAYASAAHAVDGTTVHRLLSPLPSQHKVWRDRTEFDLAMSGLVADCRKSRADSRGKGYYILAHKQRELTMKHLDVLVIDELSLLTPELFRMLDEALRAVRQSLQPFGGVTLVTVGDPAQLPPVPLRGEDVRYVFEDPLWTKAAFKYEPLTTVIRQSDALFVEVLDAVRAGDARPFKTWPAHLQAALLERAAPDAVVLDATGAPHPAVTKLRSTNAEVDAINNGKMTALPGDARVYPVTATARIGVGSEQTGDPTQLASTLQAGPLRDALTEEATDPNKRSVALKVDATVVLTYNLDTTAGLYNGSIGVITALKPDVVTVRFRTGPVDVRVVTVERAVAGGAYSLEYMPLRPAYACTVDKSQGLTLDAADILISKRMKDGAAYTALSRVRSLDSLVIRMPDGEDDIAMVFNSAFRTSPAVAAFLKARGL